MKPTEPIFLTYGDDTWEVADVRTHDGKGKDSSRINCNTITDAALTLIRSTQDAFYCSTPFGGFNFEVNLSSVTHKSEAIRPKGSIKLPQARIYSFQDVRSLVHVLADDSALTFEEWEAKQNNLVAAKRLATTRL